MFTAGVLTPWTNTRDARASFSRESSRFRHQRGTVDRRHHKCHHKCHRLAMHQMAPDHSRPHKTQKRAPLYYGEKCKNTATLNIGPGATAPRPSWPLREALPPPASFCLRLTPLDPLLLFSFFFYRGLGRFLFSSFLSFFGPPRYDVTRRKRPKAGHPGSSPRHKAGQRIEKERERKHTKKEKEKQRPNTGGWLLTDDCIKVARTLEV